jgi:hypothetical protein
MWEPMKITNAFDARTGGVLIRAPIIIESDDVEHLKRRQHILRLEKRLADLKLLAAKTK